MSRVLRLRGLGMGFAVYENDKERVAESSYSDSRQGAETLARGRHMQSVKDKFRPALRRTKTGWECLKWSGGLGTICVHQAR